MNSIVQGTTTYRSVRTAKLAREKAVDAVSGAKNQTSFKMILIYEDLASGKRGKLFSEKLAGELGSDCGLVHNLWKFDVLGIPAIRNLAATAAAAADIVVFSLSGAKLLSEEVKDWLEMWVWLIDRTKPALVALFDHPDGEVMPTRGYLRSIAARKQLEFFPHTVPAHHVTHTHLAGGIARQICSRERTLAFPGNRKSRA